MSRFKTKFCWWPVLLARRVEPTYHNGPTLEKIGWVWMQRAYLVNNLNHGWIAVLDTKLEPEKCKKCGQLLPPNGNL